jgi:hypothetical protein
MIGNHSSHICRLDERDHLRDSNTLRIWLGLTLYPGLLQVKRQLFLGDRVSHVTAEDPIDMHKLS